MKLQLLHIFDDGREVWTDGNNTFQRWNDNEWDQMDFDYPTDYEPFMLTAAREEALELDHKITTPSAIYLKKGRRSVALYGSVAYLKWRDAVIDEVQEVQAAFRWLFLGRLD